MLSKSCVLYKNYYPLPSTWQPSSENSCTLYQWHICPMHTTYMSYAYDIYVVCIEHICRMYIRPICPPDFVYRRHTTYRSWALLDIRHIGHMLKSCNLIIRPIGHMDIRPIGHMLKSCNLIIRPIGHMDIRHICHMLKSCNLIIRHICHMDIRPIYHEHLVRGPGWRDGSDQKWIPALGSSAGDRLRGAQLGAQQEGPAEDQIKEGRPIPFGLLASPPARWAHERHPQAGALPRIHTLWSVLHVWVYLRVRHGFSELGRWVGIHPG